MSRPHPLPIRIAQTIGVTAPAIYSSITFAYSYICIPPLVDHAPPKLLAKQWLQAYKYGPRFVPPLILSGTFSNILLAYFSKDTKLKVAYGLAAILTWSIMPFTLFYMEPTINGAGKWKAQQILQDEGYRMEENEDPVPRVDRHTARPAARRWAEETSMRDIVNRWAEVNTQRYIITATATIISAFATCKWGGSLFRGNISQRASEWLARL